MKTVYIQKTDNTKCWRGYGGPSFFAGQNVK